MFEAKAYILTKEEGGRKKGFVSNFKPQFFFRTSNVTGSITIISAENLSEDSFVEERDSANLMALPGDTVIFSVILVENVALDVGLRFTIREGVITVGAGIITKVF